MYLAIATILVCGLSVAWIAGSVDHKNASKILVWDSNDSGIFSHFFQLKYVNSVAKSVGRSLTVATFSTAHNNGTTISLCNVFDLPHISCQQPNTRNKNCFSKFNKAFQSSTKNTICFRGLLWGNSGVVPARQRLNVMVMKPFLNFQNPYKKKYDIVHEMVMDLMQQHIKAVLAEQELRNRYTVVHWRRGDQVHSLPHI